LTEKTVLITLKNSAVHLILQYDIRPYFEISIQSSSEKIRKLCGNPNYSNRELEAWLDHLFAHDRTAIVAIFLMIGLPEQTAEHIVEDLDYADYPGRERTCKPPECAPSKHELPKGLIY